MATTITHQRRSNSVPPITSRNALPNLPITQVTPAITRHQSIEISNRASVSSHIDFDLEKQVSTPNAIPQRPTRQRPQTHLDNVPLSSISKQQSPSSPPPTPKAAKRRSVFEDVFPKLMVPGVVEEAEEDEEHHGLERRPTTRMSRVSRVSRVSMILPPLTVEEFQVGDRDPENPREWSLARKLNCAAFVWFSSFVATFGTPIYIAGVPSIVGLFHVSIVLGILPVTSYALGLGIGALLATAICEVFGRTKVYKIGLPLALLFIVAGGSAQSYTTIAVTRFFAGLLQGPCVTVGVGILNDMWDISLEKTGTTCAVLLVLVSIWATQVGPMVSAAVVVGKNVKVPFSSIQSWRWTFWVNAILVGLVFIWAYYIPETYHPQIIRKEKKKKGIPVAPRQVWKSILTSVGRPLHMMRAEAIIVPSGLVMAVTQSVVFSYYVAYALLFETTYAFTPYQVGMAFSPMLLGSLFAIPLVAFFDRTTYQPYRTRALASGSHVSPEKRLFPAMLGTILMPISLFWLAFSGKKSINPFVPLSSGFLFGLAYVLNMLCMPIYNNDIYGSKYAASVLAATTSLRFTISAVFPLFTKSIIDRLGMQNALCLLAGVTILMIPIPFIFYRWGPVLRDNSRYLRSSAFRL